MLKKLEIVYTQKMKRDVRLMVKRGKDITKLTVVLDLLSYQKPMPAGMSVPNFLLARTKEELYRSQKIFR